MSELDTLMEKEDFIALKTRIHLLDDKKSSKTLHLTKKVIKNLEKTQLSNGSWENTIYKTIPALDLLIDAGYKDTTVFQKGFEWLLSLTGPFGFHEYCEEGQEIYCRDEYCPYGGKLGSPELTGRVFYLCGKAKFTHSTLDNIIECIMQFQRDDNGFHGPQFWEQDKKSCIGATLWVTRGLLTLNKKPTIVRDAIDFIQKAEINHHLHQWGTSALTLETLYTYNSEKTPCVKAHITYLLSLKKNATWKLGSVEDRKKYRNHLFAVLKAISNFDQDIYTII